MPIIELHNVSKKYRISHNDQAAYATLMETVTQGVHNLLNRKKPSEEEFWALKEINLNIEEGDRIGIIGKNGAGKSTLLKILSRITQPTTGKIKLSGKVSSLLEVGTGFHPELTGRENIFLNGAILGMSSREITQKFDAIVSFAEVEQFLDTPVKRFSTGMHTRLGFAIAAHLEPDIFLVDEVLAVGDLQFQEKCLKKLNELSGNGRTILFVSHNVGSILTLCNKGIFLEKGRLIDFGPIEACASHYVRASSYYGLQWEGDEGDEHIRFHKAILKPPQEMTRDFFYQNEETTLELEYEVLKLSVDMKLGIGIWNQRNHLLASSYTSDDPLFSFSKGRQKISFPLNANLFHEGEYQIKLDCAIHNKKRILSDQICLKFSVYAPHKNTRFHHSSQREGLFLGSKWESG